MAVRPHKTNLHAVADRFRVPGCEAVDLRRRKALRAMLLRLVEHHRAEGQSQTAQVRVYRAALRSQR